MKKIISNQMSSPHAAIALRAYHLWEAAEMPENQSLYFWLQAEEAEVKNTPTQGVSRKQPVGLKTRRKALPAPKPTQAAPRLVKPATKVTTKNPKKPTMALSKNRRSKG
ncbi:MAG: DUF2934 domain-containing protein [Prosthecobacter sp.]|nr:DUF2934 domain-containing protein [Prosthecobacter sp.]